MNKAEQVSIGRHAFVCEHGAYKILDDYLKRSERSLSKDPDSAEILQDLELSMAGHLNELVKGQVIDEKSAQAVVDMMGEVAGEDDGSEKTNSDSASESFGERLKTLFQRPIYKDHDREIVDGVCAGVARSLAVDPIWVRISAIALTIITSGFFILVYLLLMATMKDDPIYQKKSARQVVGDVKDKLNESMAGRPRYEMRLQKFFKWIINTIVFAGRLIVLLILLVVAALWSVLLFFMVTNPAKVVLFGSNPTVLDFTAIVTAGLVILLPIFTLIGLMVGSGFVKNSRYNLVTACVWVLALIASIGAFVNVAPNVYNRLVREQPKTDSVYVEVVDGDLAHFCLSLFGNCQNNLPTIYNSSLCGHQLRMIDMGEDFNNIQNQSWRYNEKALNPTMLEKDYCAAINELVSEYDNAKIVFVKQDLNDDKSYRVSPTIYRYDEYEDTIVQDIGNTDSYWQLIYFTR